MGFKIGQLTRLDLGYVGENASRCIEINVSDWLGRWPNAIIALTVQRPTEDDLYIPATEIENGILSWLVLQSDTAIAGEGLAQFRALDPESGSCYVSRVVETIVTESMYGTTDPEAPDKSSGWVNEVLSTAKELEENADQINKVLSLEAKAVTLPADSEATASYADGVLTLGLPRGEKGDKGDVGSAASIKVNGIEGVDDNITITGEDVPLSADDDTPLNTAITQLEAAAEQLATDVEQLTTDVEQLATDAEQLTADVEQLQSAMPSVLDAYPVGALYWSSKSTSPASLFGGTWTQIKDRFILAAGSSYSNGATGGAATVTLTIDQIPSHRHDAKVILPSGESGTSGYGIEKWASGEYGYKAASTNYVGGGGSHNNMPPYIVKYCWERTA